MTVLKNDELCVLEKVFTEIRDNDGYVSNETFKYFSIILQDLKEDKANHNEKIRLRINEKRKTDKNYARKKNK